MELSSVERTAPPARKPREAAVIPPEGAGRVSGGLNGFHLIALSLVVSALLAFGIHYIRQVPTGPASPASGAVVQVHLQPAAAPQAAAPAPVAVDEVRPTVKAPDNPAPAKAELPLVAVAKTAALEAPPSQVLTASTSSPPSTSDAASDFQRALFAHIERVRQYPDAARGQHLHGVVKVLFAMERNGKILGVWIKTSSGSMILDQAAMDTIRRAQPLPHIPSNLPGRLNVVLPVAFEAP